MLPGEKSGVRAGFPGRTLIGKAPHSALRPAGGLLLKISRLESGRRLENPIPGPETLLHIIGYVCHTIFEEASTGPDGKVHSTLMNQLDKFHFSFGSLTRTRKASI